LADGRGSVFADGASEKSSDEDGIEAIIGILSDLEAEVSNELISAYFC
jgi:hypothetical protein